LEEKAISNKPKKESRNRTNEQIRVPRVRLIDQNGNQLGIVDTREALELAAEAKLDLVEIQPNVDPPVTRLMNYGKFLFKLSKDKTAAKKKQKKTKTKEIKLRPTTDENDLETKLNNARKFLGVGDKVKVTVWFRGREISHHELGLQLLARVRDMLEDVAKVEHFPDKLEGKQVIMVLAPKLSKT
jgi:translation initiation factor IF-3